MKRKLEQVTKYNESLIALEEIPKKHTQKRTPQKKAAKLSAYEDKHTKQLIISISNLRKVLFPLIEDLVNQNFMNGMNGNKIKIDIIIDAIIYIAYREKSTLDNFDTQACPIISKMMDKKKCTPILKELCNGTVSFQNVVNRLVSTLNLNKRKYKYLETLMGQKALRDKPDIRIALQMYLLKGQFHWIRFDENGQFSKYLFDDNIMSLDDDARINCWEAIFYGLIKANILSKSDLKDRYELKSSVETQELLEKGFQFKSWTRLSKIRNKYKGLDWRDILKNKPHFIMMEGPLSHDMISIPYSNKQLLKMLITEQFDEKPLRAKLYSHWTMWTAGTVGTVSKRDFNAALGAEMRAAPIDEFFKIR